MKTPIKHPSIWILICALSVLLASLGSAISAESPNNQDMDTLMKESPKYEDSAALPDDIKKAVLAYLETFAPNNDFKHYEWQNPEIVKFAKVILTEQTRKIIGRVPAKEVYCVTCQADEVCKKTHTEFKTCDEARVDDRIIPLGYPEEITAGKKGRFSFNWILARGQSGGETYIVNFTEKPDEPTHSKDSKWAAVCPYGQIITDDSLKKKAAQEEECSKWLKANPDYLKKKMAQEARTARMIALPRKSFKGYDDVIQKLGKPKLTTVTKVDNRHDPSATDIITSLEYPGLIIAVYKTPKYKKEFIISLTLTKRPKQLPLPVTIGASREFVLSRLGEPLGDEGDTIIYKDDFGDLEIHFKDSRVSRIGWIFCGSSRKCVPPIFGFQPTSSYLVV